MATPIVAVAFAGLSLASYVLWLVRRADADRRRVGRAPRTSIADLKVGSVAKIVGRVRLQQGLTAPLAGGRCACYSLEVTHVGGESQAILVSDSRGVPFDVEDTTGKLKVDTTLFRLVSGRDSTIAHRLPRTDPRPTFLQYLESHADRASSGHQAALALVRQRAPLHVCEQAVCDGDTVAVLGQVAERREANGSRALVLMSPDTSELVISTKGSTFL